MPQRGRRVPPLQERKQTAPGVNSVAAPRTRQPKIEGPIDLTLPRVCYYREFEDAPDPCPRCGATLVQQRASYLIATRSRGKDADSFISSNDAGWFCLDCPTVVVNADAINKLLGHRLRRWNVGHEFVVMGLVDLDAVPPEKGHLPLGEDNNPIPLIPFSFEE